MRDADVCLIVIDINSKLSADGINRWLDFVKDTRGHDGITYLVGNKVDLDREVEKK